MYGFNHGWMFDGGIGWIAWLWMALFMLVPVLLLFALGKYVFGKNSVERQRTALDILDEAYARGEIQREDYLQKRADLQGK